VEPKLVPSRITPSLRPLEEYVAAQLAKFGMARSLSKLCRHLFLVA
jgi:hypothetical protein